MKEQKIRTLFLDIGGVLLTDGWNSLSREMAVEYFRLDKAEMSERHGMVFDTYELDKMTLDDYLNYVIFNQPQEFSKEDFINFMYGQSQPLPGAIEFFKDLKQRNQLKVVALSNEPRDLNAYRIKKFELNKLFDAFVSSCYIKMRKPDPDMYRMACDVSQTPKEEGLYIDDRLPYIEVANDLGFNCLHYQGVDAARKYFEQQKFL